jgi:methylmalonyl-CoA/ethylmalonyl-CoA epimerase
VRLHHVGLVVRDITASVKAHGACFHIEQCYGPVVDTLQEAEIVMLRPESGPWIELLRPTTATSPLARALRDGGGLHHLCFAVPDVSKVVQEVRSRGGVVICPPTKAIAFGGLEVAFAFYRHVGLVEYVDERATPPFCSSLAIEEVGT